MSMQRQFPAYYRPSANEIAESWQDSLFAIDANVLLNLYRFPTKAQQDLLAAFDTIRAQLWVPYLAALEFQRNRHSVIAEQSRKTANLRTAVEKVRTTAKKEINGLGLRNRHPSIDPDRHINLIEEAINASLHEIAQVESTLQPVTGHDPIRDRLDAILNDRIGEGFDSDRIQEISKEGKDRYAKLIPPGYQDRRKDSGESAQYFRYDGVTYERQYSDLVIWKEIIDKARSDGYRSVIFVTDDAKEDWIEETKAEAPKTLGPRPELIDEIHREASVDLFHIYHSERFLEFARDSLHVSIEPETLSDVERVLRESRNQDVRRTFLSARRSHNNPRLVVRSVQDWLLAVGYTPESSIADDQFDIGMRTPTGTSAAGVLVRSIDEDTSQSEILTWADNLCIMINTTKGVSEGVLALIHTEESTNFSVLERIEELDEVLAPEIGILVGFVRRDNDGNFTFVDAYTRTGSTELLFS